MRPTLVSAGQPFPVPASPPLAGCILPSWRGYTLRRLTPARAERAVAGPIARTSAGPIARTSMDRKTIYNRFMRWAERDIWEGIFAARA
jgi:hypothetical protein